MAVALIVVAIIVVAAAAGYYALSPPANNSTTSTTSQSSSGISTSASGSTTPVSFSRDFVVGTTQTLRWLDSSAISNSIELLIGSQIYETLLRNNPQTGVPEPWLATGYTVSPNGTVYTFTLRQGVTFQDGTPFNSTAVKTSLIRAFLDPDTNSYYLSNFLKGVTGSVLTNATALKAQLNAAITTPGPYTVVFAFQGPVSFAPYIFAMGNLGIGSPVNNNRNQDQYYGTGPYKFVSWTRNDNVKLVPNPNYWNAAANQNPNIKSITFKFFSSSSAMQSALQTGTIDLGAWDWTPTQVNSLSTQQSLTLIKGEIGRFIGLDLNNKTGPLSNILVRQAIAYAIDPQQILSTVYGVIGANSQTFMPPGYQYINTTVWNSMYPHNVDKAKQLLAQAGYAGGFTTTLWYSPTQYGEAETPYVTLVQQQLAQIGITVTLNPVDTTTLIKNARTQSEPMVSLHWVYDYIGPYEYLFNLMDGSPTGGSWAQHMAYLDSTSTSLMSQIRSTTDSSALPGLYNQAQARAAQMVALVPIGFIQTIFFSQSYVHNVQAAWIGSSAANAAFAKVTFTQ